MSSAPDSISAGTIFKNYRLVERLGDASQTWLAEDTRNGNKVAVKILSRILPKDKATRDSALKEIRLKAAIGHPGIANVIQIDIDHDVLWMASELVEGETLSTRAGKKKADRKEFFRFAWQMADILAAIHRNSVVLGNITGNSWVITPDNDVKFVGFRFGSFMGKQDTGQTLLSGIKPTHLREAAYLSPEQVTGKLVTSKSDIFALGVCMYELIAGTLPFKGASVSDVAHAVNTASPPAPQNPDIERTLLAPIGKCIHKNPNSRYDKVALLKDDLAKAEPDIDTLARRRGVTSPGGIPLPKRETRSATEAFIVVGELPYHEILRSKDPERAGRLENTMQQYLGEAVYLFDGTVLDSLGPVMVASLGDGESAIKAAQKGLTDLVEHNMTHAEEPVEARMLVHYGELVPAAGKPEGSGLTTAMSVLEAMEPLQLLVSKPVIDRVDVAGEPVSIGRLADIDFFQAPELREPEPEPTVDTEGAPATDSAPAPAAPIPQPDALPVEPAPSGPTEAAPARPPSRPETKKGLPIALVGIAAILVLIVGAAVAFLIVRGDAAPEPVAQPVAQAPRPVEQQLPTVEIDPDLIFFGAFTYEQSDSGASTAETTDPGATDEQEPIAAPEIPSGTVDIELQEAAAELRSAIDRLTTLDPDLERVIAPSEDSRTVAGRLGRSDDGVVLTPVVVVGENESVGNPITVTDPDTTALAYVRQVWRSLERDLTFLPGDDATVAKYLEARSLRDSGDLANALTEIQEVTGVESGFIPALELQMNLLFDLEQEDEAIETAKRIALLDRDDTEIRHRLANWEFERGNPGYGLVWLGELVEQEPENVDILMKIGQYALAVGDAETFNAVLTRLQSFDIENPRLSQGDIILARGRLDAAAKKYYEDQNAQPDNPILSLKIGRLAVLRRSDSIIRAEMERLQRLQAPYELAMMQAYVDANDGNAEGAEIELRRAEELATPLDPLYTATAEVYLLLNRQDQVLEALEKAVGRAEPTHEYILSNPIFGYLANDPRFRNVLQTVGEQRTRITAGLSNVQL